MLGLDFCVCLFRFYLLLA